MLRDTQKTLVSGAQLARRYAVQPRTIKRWTDAGILPKPIVIHDNTLRYDLDECDEAIERRSASMSAEPAK